MNNFKISTNLKESPTFKKNLWLKLKNEILGEEYDLSLIFIGEKKSKTLNKIFRKKRISCQYFFLSCW